MSAKRILLVLFGLVSLGVVAVAVVLAIVVPRWVERRVTEEARARGVEIQSGDINFGWQWVQITDAKVTLIGVPGLTASVGVVDVQLAGFEPQRVLVNRVDALASGDPTALLTALDSWRAAHAKDLRTPLAIKPLSFKLNPPGAGAPLVTLNSAELSLTAERVALRGPTVTALGRELGAFSAQKEREDTRVAVTLGQGALENPTLSIEQSGGTNPALHVALAPLTLAKVSELTGVPLPHPEVLASGTVDLKGGIGRAPLGHLNGQYDIILKGYVPPHPVELDGFVFGDVTEASSKFAVEPELLRVRFTELKVKAGQFAVAGAGELRLEGDHGRFTASLVGALPCGALAAATAETRLGRALGRLTGKAALQTLNGAVGVRVAIDADSRQLEKTQVLKTISPGCGLRPLSLAELRALGELAPDALDPAVLRDIDTLLKNPLPALPNLGPGVKLDLPTLQLPLAPPLPPAKDTAAKPGAAKSAASAQAKPSASAKASPPAKSAAGGARAK